jgi:hypothetical protein
MKKIIVLMVGILLLSAVSPLSADELEVGVSLFPIKWASTEGEEAQLIGEGSFINDWLFGYHFARAWFLFYLSWDAFVLPPFVVQDITTIVEGEVVVREGFYRPGFINFFDFGIRLTLFEIATGFAELGINTLYVYKQQELPVDQRPGAWGANLRIGAGVRISPAWGAILTGTAMFPSFDKMMDVLRGLGSDNVLVQNAAKSQIKMFPSVMFVMYL